MEFVCQEIMLFLAFLICFQVVRAFQPEFSRPMTNISVAVGKEATFSCHVRYLGGYRVAWLKSDTKAIQAIHEHVITHNSRVSVTHSDQNTWNLHIKSVTEEDRGGYMCQLNTDPMKSQIGYLNVAIPPDLFSEDTSSDVIVPEGSSIILTCRSRGYPEPVVTWRREDGSAIVIKNSNGTKKIVTSFRGGVLKLMKISRSDMGSYVCIASNGVPPSVLKRISLTIHFHPDIHVPNQLVGAPLTTDVKIECHVEASPKSINYWIKDTGEMIVSSSKYDVQEIFKSAYETRLMLIVRNFQKEDVGSYRCMAKNSLGEVDSNVRLYDITGSKNLHPIYGFGTNITFENNQLNKAATSQPDDDEQYVSIKKIVKSDLSSNMYQHQRPYKQTFLILNDIISINNNDNNRKHHNSTATYSRKPSSYISGIRVLAADNETTSVQSSYKYTYILLSILLLL